MLHCLTKAITASLAVGVASIVAPIDEADAQALSPMRKLITSYSDQFAIRVHPKNPYSHRIRMEIRVYDTNFQLTPARVSPRSMLMGAGTSRPVTVIVPFLGKREKRVRICAESIPYSNQPTMIKAQVCGKFYAVRAN